MDALERTYYPYYDMNALPPSYYFSIGILSLVIGVVFRSITSDPRILIVACMSCIACISMSCIVQVNRIMEHENPVMDE
jgi:hypothetical protein